MINLTIIVNKLTLNGIIEVNERMNAWQTIDVLKEYYFKLPKAKAANDWLIDGYSLNKQWLFNLMINCNGKL